MKFGFTPEELRRLRPLVVSTGRRRGNNNEFVAKRGAPKGRPAVAASHLTNCGIFDAALPAPGNLR